MDDDAANTTVVESIGRNSDGTARRNTSDLSTSSIIDGALTFDGTERNYGLESPWQPEKSTYNCEPHPIRFLADFVLDNARSIC